MALYLKYRPQSLEQLLGQDHIKKTLASAFLGNKLSHAYLFVGPRGTGKTSTARILAKMVNCQNQSDSMTLMPCNKCQACLSITDGSNLDLIEIDAASNRGIDDIRSLREKIKLAPAYSKKKVYIIDEVHMLTTEAFNALLKTLEEPPAHALFILATTEVQKVPQTILSRVQRLDFKLAKPDQLKIALERIIQEEKIDIEQDALSLVIKRAEGSFRDGVKFLDQVGSIGGKITRQVVEDNLKSGKFEEIISLAQAIASKNTTESLKVVVDQVDKGVDIKDFMFSLMDLLRSVVFIKNGLGEVLVSPNYSEEKYSQLVDLSQKFTNQSLISALDTLQQATEKLKFASIPSLPLEVAVLEICSLVELSEKLQKPESKQAQLVEPPAIVTIEKETPAYIPILPDLTNIPSSPDGSDILKLKDKWTFILETVRQYNFSLEALLRQINIKECTTTTVILEVPYAFHQRILEAPKNRELIESLLIDILGRPIRIVTTLGVRPARREDIVNIEVAADDEVIRAAAEIFNSDSIN